MKRIFMSSFFWALFGACTPTSYSSYLETTMLNLDGVPTANIKLEIRDRNGDVFAEEMSDSTGYVRISLPPHETFFAIVSFEDHRSISYTGFSGDGTFDLPAGTLSLRDEIEIADIKQWSTLCEGQVDDSVDYSFEQIRVDGNVLSVPAKATVCAPSISQAVAGRGSSRG